MKPKPANGKMPTLVGKGVSRGQVRGKAFVYRDVLQRDSDFYVILPTQVDEEKTRIRKAIDDVRQSLAIDAKQIEKKFDKQCESWHDLESKMFRIYMLTAIELRCTSELDSVCS